MCFYAPWNPLHPGEASVSVRYEIASVWPSYAKATQEVL